MMLADKVAIITGAGRERGMGQAAVHRFAEHGCHVVVTDLAASNADRAILEKIADEARAFGVNAIPMAVDVTDAQAVKHCADQTVAELGAVDIMINNAGTALGSGPFLEQTEQQLSISLDVHVRGTWYFCQAVIPHMQKAGGGAIVNNASMLGIAAEPFTAAYTASKFAVVGLTKAIASEFGKDNIRCNAVCPGSINTQMQDEGIKRFAEWHGISEEEAWADAERCALGRSAEPLEVADTMVYLASSMSSYISGVALPVTGAANPGV